MYGLSDDLIDAQQRAERDRLDAARYRFLREQTVRHWYLNGFRVELRTSECITRYGGARPEALDEAIDAAMEPTRD